MIWLDKTLDQVGPAAGTTNFNCGRGLTVAFDKLQLFSAPIEDTNNRFYSITDAGTQDNMAKLGIRVPYIKARARQFSTTDTTGVAIVQDGREQTLLAGAQWFWRASIRFQV